MPRSARRLMGHTEGLSAFRRTAPHLLLEPRLPPAKKTRGFGAVEPAAWWSPLGMRENARPKAREMAGNSAFARPPPYGSLHSWTGWRRGQSSANPSLRQRLRLGLDDQPASPDAERGGFSIQHLDEIFREADPWYRSRSS
jgi:hypothetical protein